MVTGLLPTTSPDSVFKVASGTSLKRIDQPWLLSFCSVILRPPPLHRAQVAACLSRRRRRGCALINRSLSDRPPPKITLPLRRQPQPVHPLPQLRGRHTLKLHIRIAAR